ncbi:MAG: hypothetical protein M1816_004021 [Peltula sp. TS41687]|nr:MAG: hypothetical protein M1816_004021 [Peltula sp. TS41687]
MAETKYKLPILNDNNYKIRAQILELHLQGKGYWDVVSGATAKNEADPSWVQKNATAAAIILSTCNEMQIQHVLNIKIASEQWTIFKNIHELSNQHRLDNLQ